VHRALFGRDESFERRHECREVFLGDLPADVCVDAEVVMDDFIAVAVCSLTYRSRVKERSEFP
jgi:hypothetical protein